MNINLSNLFKKKYRLKEFLKVDIHSHLIHGVDDGSKTIEESLGIIKKLEELGVNKIITTPHIMHGYYENTKDIILSKLAVLKKELELHEINIELKAAAEYFLDEHFISLLENKDELLIIENEYLLFETAFLNKPAFLEDAVFKIKSLGLTPLMAHPERYIYLISEPGLALKLKQMGCAFQVNLRSFTKTNSISSRNFIKWAFDNDLVDFVGSDIHNNRQLMDVAKVMETRLFDERMMKAVKNNNLA